MNNVTVSLGLKDQLTSPLRGVMSGVRGELRSIEGTSQVVGNSIGAMTAGFVGLAAGIAGTALAMAGLGSGVMNAATTQTSMISSAGDVSNLIGTTYSAALVAVKDVQKEIVKIAASLPGETAGYAGIANAVTASIALGAKGNLTKMKEDVLEVTKTLGLLAATKNVDMTMGASASNKFISGSASISELFGTNDIFQKNPLFKTYLQEQLKTIGKSTKDWEKLDQETRNKVTVLAGKRAFTKDMLSKLDGTADSLIQGIKTSLFDPQVGIFGFLREVKGLDSKDALSRVQVFLGALVQVSESLGKAGFNFDPMLEIGKSLNYMSDVLYSVNLGITKGDWGSMKTMVKNIWKNILTIPKALADGINVGIEFLKSIDWSAVSGYIAQGLDAITKGISTINWGDLGVNVGKAIGDILTSKELGTALDKSITAALQGLGEMLGGAILGAGEAFLKDPMSIFREQNKPGSVTVEDPKAKYKGGLYDPDTWKGINQGINDMFGTGKTFQGGQLPEGAKPLPQLQSNNSSVNNQQMAFAPVVNITGVANNLQETADYVMSAMNSKYTEYKQTILT